MACLDEAQATAFAAGTLGPAVRAELATHVSDCARCQARITAREPTAAALGATHVAPTPDLAGTLPASAESGPRARATTDAEWPAGTRVGRYVVRAPIGRGGMGAVYRAEDLELGRPVALKRLLADADADARARLVREARAAAALQHPNVVAVHEVGEDAGVPFLAMELVDGVTLTAWLRERARTWREIVGVIAQAGRGLAAAHARGLVHRDFKPDNVLVDRAGRARVADFGLARAGDEPAPASDTRARADARLARMTETGALAGTPAYMAPELVAGAAPDARSDQYALAVTLAEALQGEHPFAGTTAVALWEAMAAERMRPARRRLPAWLDRAVRRGLAADPARRWPSIAVFLAAIERAPRRRAAWIGAGVVLVAAAGVVTFVATRAHEPTCDDLAAAALPPILASDLDAIVDAAQRQLARDRLHAFTSDYRAGVRQACLATRSGAQSPELSDKRTACLTAARRAAQDRFGGMVEAGGQRARVATALEHMPDADRCSDPVWLARPTPAGVTADHQAEFAGAEAQLAEADRERDAGRLARAYELATSARATATEISARALATRADLLLVELDRDRGDVSAAESDAQAAVGEASVLGDSDLALRAQLALIASDAARAKSTIATFAGLGADVSESADGAELVAIYAKALAVAGRLSDAEAQARRALSLRERLLPPGHPDIAQSQELLGEVLALEHRPADAQAQFALSQPVLAAKLPPLRREAIEGLRFQAMVEEDLGHAERALALRQEIVARRERLVGGTPGLLRDARADVARTLGDLGRDAEAVTVLETVIAGYLAESGETTVNLATARVELANRLVTLGRFAEADAALARALPAIAKARGEDSPYTFAARFAQVRSWVERPHPIELPRATATLAAMEPVFAKMFGASSPTIAAVLEARARVRLASGDAAGAGEALTAALAMLGDAQRADRAELALLHARVLWRLHRADDARAAATAAAADYAAAGPGFAARAAAATAWLAHPAP